MGWVGERVRGGMPKRVDIEKESCGPLFFFAVSQPWLWRGIYGSWVGGMWSGMYDERQSE